MPNLYCLGPGESVDTHIVGIWNKKKSDLGVISVQVVLSQLKMPHFNCWCPGESVDTNIVGVGKKKRSDLRIPSGLQIRYTSVIGDSIRAQRGWSLLYLAKYPTGAGASDGSARSALELRVLKKIIIHTSYRFLINCVVCGNYIFSAETD